jgi:hypothetical protein
MCSAGSQLPDCHQHIVTSTLSLQGKGGEDVTMEAAKDDAAEAGFVPPESAGSGKAEGSSPLVRTNEVGYLLPL